MFTNDVQLMRSDQTKIFYLGQKMVHGDYIDRIKAEGELLRFIKDMVIKVEKRKEILLDNRN